MKLPSSAVGGLISLIVMIPGTSVRAAGDVTITADAVYGHKDGLALTMDVLTPKNRNGAAVVFIVSGGWGSHWYPPEKAVVSRQPLLDAGFTVFSVRHGSAPKYLVPQIIEDVRRSIRFIRHSAERFGINPNKIGVTSASSGGHLALMLATTADEGNPKANDEVLRASSRVQAVVAYFPPTDLREWVKPGSFYYGRYAALRFDPAKAAACSPILHVDKTDTATLLVHGDRDPRVPLGHSQRMLAALKKHGVPGKLVVIMGAGHGFSGDYVKQASKARVAWFEKHLLNKPAAKSDPHRPTGAGILDFNVKLTTISRGYDRKTCWVHPRGGVVPPSTAVITMQKLLLTGTDVFYAVNEMRTDDLGATWRGPVRHETLARRDRPNGFVVCPCDFWPQWHARTGKLLGTGQTALYKDNAWKPGFARSSVYSVYDADKRAWAEWKTIKMPDEKRFRDAGAGCTQRYDLPNGDVLLPFYWFGPEPANGEIKPGRRVAVMRCKFDGRDLTYVEHGTELIPPVPVGFYEPSLTKFGDKFYLTIRNETNGHVATSDDGLHFDKPRPWVYDDGTELGSVSTQQHWIAHSDGLFLVYNRRGPENLKVFRHRAPLFIGQVDPSRLCVIRKTERALVPDRGAILGNFGTMNVSKDESWVTVAEWMQHGIGARFNVPEVCEKGGSDNSVYVAKIRWKKPNKLVDW